MLEAAGIPAGPINAISQALADIQAQHRQMVRTMAGLLVRARPSGSMGTAPIPTSRRLLLGSTQMMCWQNICRMLRDGAAAVRRRDRLDHSSSIPSTRTSSWFWQPRAINAWAASVTPSGIAGSTANLTCSDVVPPASAS